jgi:xanthine dehydrogenase large subunit
LTRCSAKLEQIRPLPGAARSHCEVECKSSPVIKRGIAITPVKFGISFTATLFNQAGALVHVYTDGSVQVNHGGTEMGQGLNTKVAQIVADELGVPFGAGAAPPATPARCPMPRPPRRPAAPT